jgi:hypothetical protein
VTDLKSIAEEIETYLRTGDHDPHHLAWSGGFMERNRQAHEDLREALIREVRRLAGRHVQRSIPETDAVGLARRKIEPMVRGLFRRVEQEAVLTVLERSVIFVSDANLERILRSYPWHKTAWSLANLYLASVGAEPLGEEAPGIVGLSVETTCFVSPEYFAENDPFADFVVHEAAHIFHNCKRCTVGLAETRRREFLLNIEFRRREIFAYSCEAYSRILERARTAGERRLLAAEYGAKPRIPDTNVDQDEVAEIVLEAAAARNGWKVILACCAPPAQAPARPNRLAGSQEPIEATGESGDIRETLFLLSIPGMRESIVDGMKTPVVECAEDLDG